MVLSRFLFYYVDKVNEFCFDYIRLENFKHYALKSACAAAVNREIIDFFLFIHFCSTPKQSIAVK